MSVVRVVIVEPWIDPDGNRRLPGQTVILHKEVYARHAGLGYFARSVVRARHFSGREYWHQTGCSGTPLVTRLPVPEFLEPPRDVPIHPLVRAMMPPLMKAPVRQVVYHRCGCQKEQKK